MNVSEMNGIELAQEVTRRFDSIKDEEDASVWIGDCQDRYSELNEEEQVAFLNNLSKEYGGRKE